MARPFASMFILILTIASVGCILDGDESYTVVASASGTEFFAGDDVRIEGTVNYDDGDPVPGIEVEIAIGDHILLVTTDSNGEFHRDFSIPQGTQAQQVIIGIYAGAASSSIEISIVPRTTPAPAGGYVTYKDIVYADRPGCDPYFTSLDVFTPVAASEAPIVIFVHGGAWMAGDKEGQEQRAQWCASNGFMLVSINYRLSPAYVHPSIIEDVAAAIAWVVDNAWYYGGDADNIFLMGHSAGAHLVALVVTDETRLEAHGIDPSSINGVITLDGAAYDLPARIIYDPSLYGAISMVFGGTLDELKEGSPYYHVDPGEDLPPFLLFCIDGREISLEQSTSLSEVLVGAGGYAEVEVAYGKTHTTLETDFGKEGDVPTSQALAFIYAFMDD